jgi:hypothetical protein
VTYVVSLSFCLWKAGIDGQNLTIALEPEAASLYCKNMPGLDSPAMLKAGSKYLILDAGGLDLKLNCLTL